MNLKRFNPLRLFNHSSRYTKEEALQIAKHFNLVTEVQMALERGYSPDEALQDWDIYPYSEEQYKAWIN